MGTLNPATPRPKPKNLAAHCYIFSVNAPSLSGLVKPVVFRSCGRPNPEIEQKSNNDNRRDTKFINHGWTRINTDKGTSDGKRFGDEINYVKERSAE
jgi:hypothetical protein